MCAKSQIENSTEKSKIPEPSSGLKYWVTLAKWFLWTFAVGIVTLVIDHDINTRKTSLAELKEYGKYVTELIVLNPDPVNKFYLAQYMTCITTNKALKKGWKEYYDAVYPEYIKEKDSLDLQYERLLTLYNAIQASGKDQDAKNEELIKITTLMEKNRQKLIPSFQLPESQYVEH